MDPSPALAVIKEEEHVAVLLAVESGSRAWGFASIDSDWDVRFIYARPTLWHLNLRPGRDVIERTLPNDLDVSGWDMRKTLNLILRGNCAVREWLYSPIVYQSESYFVERLRALADKVPSRSAAMYHYASLAYQVRERWLRRDPVNLKKYLYAVRPALAMRWMRTHPTGMPPMNVMGLLSAISLSPSETVALHGLLKHKAAASEMGTGEALPAIDALVDSELLMAKETAMREPKGAPHPDLVEEANVLLIEAARFADLWA